MEERKISRLTSDAVIECIRDGQRSQHRCHNISRAGCMIERGCLEVEVGDTLQLELLEGVRVESEVIWLRENSLGVAFKRQLHLAAVRYLSIIDQDEFGRAPMLDRFGRPLPDIMQSSAA